MIKTLTAIKGLNISKEIKDRGSFINVILGLEGNIKINVYSKFYTITVISGKKEINKTFNHNDTNLVNSILEMQKLASLYM